MSDNNVIEVTKYRCRFCSTTDGYKHYLVLKVGNPWSPTICEDCVDDCTATLAKLRAEIRNPAK